MQKWSCVLMLIVAFGAGVACSGGHGGPSDATPPAVTAFADEIALQGYGVHPQDGHTQVEMKWSALRKLSVDYDVFVHAIDSSNAVVFQLDHPLKNTAGQMTAAWDANTPMTDTFLATPPTGRAPGSYTLRIGVYVANPMKVLQITRSGFAQPKDGWNDHAVLIENVDCK